MTSIINKIVNDFQNEDVIYSNHSAVRLFENGLTRKDINDIIDQVETIEKYLDDYPCPSILVLGYIDNSPYHIVIAKCEINSRVVTIYHPDDKKWMNHRRRIL